tara:strand:- start:1439 stop:1813 length:375 start_codon:yes stop_codon:yes gene_type:complete
MLKNEKPIKISIVEDDPIVAMDMEESFLEAGLEVVSSSASHSNAMLAAQNDEADIFTLDFELGKETSEDVAKILKSRKIPFILISGQVEKAKKHGVFKDVAHFNKPFRLGSIMTRIKKIFVKTH